MKLIPVVVAVSMLGLPVRGLAAEPAASPPAAAPDAAPPPSPDPAAATAPAPAAAAGPDAASPPARDASSTWEDPPPASEAPPAAVPPPPVAAPPPARKDSISARIKANPELLRQYRSGKNWAIGGGIGAGVGLILGISGAYVAVLASRAKDAPEDNTLSGAEPTGITEDALTAGLVMAGIGGVGLAAGGAIMVVGLLRRKSVIDEAKTYPPVAVAPFGGKNHGGLALTGRF